MMHERPYVLERTVIYLSCFVCVYDSIPREGNSQGHEPELR